MLNRRFFFVTITCNVIWILINFLIFCPFVHAETIYLKSGKTIEGKILEKTDKYIKIDFQGVRLTYYWNEIDHVKGLEDKSIHPIIGSRTELSESATNVYFDKEYGIRLVFPVEWKVKSGKALREQKSVEMGKKLTAENLASHGQDEPGFCPLTKDKETMSKLIGGMKDSALSSLPLVSAHKYDPNTVDENSNPYMELTVRKASSNEPLEDAKLVVQLSVKMFQCRFIENIQNVDINGIKGIRAAYEMQTGQGSRIEACCFLVSGDKIYGLAFTCPSADFEKLKVDFDEVVNSFEIINEPKT